MPASKKAPSRYRITVDPTPEKSVKTTVKTGLQNKKVQVSIAGIAVIAACGALGFALNRPAARRDLSQYYDHIGNYVPRLSRKSSMSERLLNQITDMLSVRGRR